MFTERKGILLAIAFLLLSAIACRGDPSFSEAIGLLGQERSYAESGAALIKRYSPDDIDARRRYADAKATFDGLVEQLLADLAQNRDPELSPSFRDRLNSAVEKRFAFSEHVNAVLEAKIPKEAKLPVVDALAKLPADLVKELVAGGIAIWREWRGATVERRNQISTRIEAQRWKLFSEIAAAL
jgi:hypothetical protein